MIHGDDSCNHLGIAGETLTHPAEGIARRRADARACSIHEVGAATLRERASGGDAADVGVRPRRRSRTDGDTAIGNKRLI